jgi:hypothetical protein
MPPPQDVHLSLVKIVCNMLSRLHDAQPLKPLDAVHAVSAAPSPRSTRFRDMFVSLTELGLQGMVEEL